MGKAVTAWCVFLSVNGTKWAAFLDETGFLSATKPRYFSSKKLAEMVAAKYRREGMKTWVVPQEDAERVMIQRELGS